MPTLEQIKEFQRQQSEAEENSRRLALVNESLASYGQRPYGVGQQDTLRPQSRLPETEEEMVARRNVEFLQAVHRLPQEQRDRVLQASTYEPGALDYLNQASASFNDAVSRGIGAPIKGIALANDIIGRTTGLYDAPAYDSSIYRFGQRAQDAARRGLDATSFLTPTTTPETQDSFWFATVPSAIGSVATTAAPALIPGVGPALALGSGAAQQATAEYEQAIKAGATPGEAALVGAINAPIGATDALTGIVGSRILRKGLSGLAGSGVGPLVASIGKGAATEGVQEGGQQYLSNLTARIYDPNRALTEGVLESAAAGGIAGGGFTGTAHVAPKLPNIIDRVLGAQQPKPTAELTPAPGADISQTQQLAPEVLEAVAQRNLSRDQQLNLGQKNAWAAGLTESTDVARQLELPPNVQLVDEQGNPIQQAPTPPLNLNQPQLNVPVAAPESVVNQDIPEISPVAAARVRNLAETKPLPDGRVTRLAPLNTPINELARYYESYGVPFNARREGGGWRITIDPQAPNRPANLDPREVLDQVNYAAQNERGGRGEIDDQSGVRGPAALPQDAGPRVAAAPAPGAQAGVPAPPQVPDQTTPPPQVPPQNVAQATISQPGVPVAQENAPSNVPTGEVTYEGNVPQTEQADAETQQGQGQEGLQVDEVVRAGAIRAADTMTEQDYNEAGYSTVLDYSTAKAQSLTLGPGAGTDATPAPFVPKPLVDVFAQYSPEFARIANETDPAQVALMLRGPVRTLNRESSNKAFDDDFKAMSAVTNISYDDLEPFRDAVSEARGLDPLSDEAAPIDRLLEQVYRKSEGVKGKLSHPIQEELGDLLPANVMRFAYNLWETITNPKTELRPGDRRGAETIIRTVFGDRLTDTTEPITGNEEVDAKVRAFEEQATQHLPEPSRPAVQQALREGRTSDAVDLSATGEDLRQVADITEQTIPEPATPEPVATDPPQTETATPPVAPTPGAEPQSEPGVSVTPTVFTDEAAKEAFNRIASKLGGSTFANAVFDPEIWADLVKIAGNYAEKAIRSAAATGFSTYRDFVKYMRNRFADVEVNVGGFPVDLGSYLAAIDHGSHMRRLWLTTRKVPERKALAGSLKRQRAAASIGYRAANLERSIRKHMSGLRASSVPTEIREQVKKVSWDRFDKSDMIEKMRRMNIALHDLDDIGGSPVPNAVFDRLTDNKGKLDRLSLPELEALRWMVKSFKHIVNEYNTERAESYINKVRTVSQQAAEEVAARKPEDVATEGFRLLPQAARKWIGQFMRDPITFTQRMGGKGSIFQKYFYGEFEKGWTKKLDAITDSNDVVLAVEKQHKMQSRQKLVNFNTIKNDYTINGQTVKLTEGELFNLYMIGQTTKGRDHVMGKSWTTRETRDDPSSNQVFTEQTFADINRQATPFMKDMADVMFPIIESLQKPMSDAKEQITGAPMGDQGPKHFPLRAISSQQERGLGELATTFGRTALENRGITLPREGGTGERPYLIENGLQVYRRYMDSATDVAFLSIPARFAMGLLGQPSFRNTLRKKVGDHAVGTLRAMIYSLSGNALPDTDPIRHEVNSAVRQWASVLSKGRLGFRLTSIVKQAAGIPMAMVEMTPSELAAVPAAMAMTTAAPYLSAVERARISMDPHMRFRISNQEGHGTVEPRGLGTLDVGKSKAGALIADVQQAGLAGLGWGDNLVTKVIWNAVKRGNPQEKGESDTDYHQRIAERTSYIVRATQNPVTPLDMSILQSSMRGSTAGPLIFMLTSSSSKIRNTLDRALDEGGFKAAKAVISTLGALMLSAGITAGHSAAVWGLRGERDKSEFEHFMKRYISSLVGELSSTAIPGMSEPIDNLLTRILTGMVKDTNSILPTGSASAIISAMMTEKPRANTVGYAVLRFLADAAPHFGLPSYPLEVSSGILKQRLPRRGGGGRSRRGGSRYRRR